MLRAQKANDCTACHMPKRQAVDGLHAAFTDHSISRFPGQTSIAAARPSGDLVPFWPGSGSRRDLALAYADVAWRSHAEADYLRALEYLKQALPEAQDDPEVLADLGYLYDLSGEKPEAIQLYRRALARDPNNLTALTNLAGHEAASGKTQQAIQLSQRAVANDPGLATPGLNLARLLWEGGKWGAAAEAVLKGLQFNPDSQKALTLQQDIEKGERLNRSPQ